MKLNKNNIKQIKTPNFKEINKLTKLQKIIKNLEMHYLSLAFNIWSDPVSKELENIFVNFHSHKKNNLSLNYINSQRDLSNREYNFFLNNQNLKNEYKIKGKSNAFKWNKNSILNTFNNENNQNLTEDYSPIELNKSCSINRKKKIKKSKINQNNIPITYKIKLSDVINFENNDMLIKSTAPKISSTMIINEDDDDDNKNISKDNDEYDNDDENIETDNEEINNDKKRKEKNSIKSYNNIEGGNKKNKNNNENKEMNHNLNNKNIPQIERNIYSKKYTKFKKLLKSDNLPSHNKEVKSYYSKDFKKNKINSYINKDEDILSYSKEAPIETSPDISTISLKQSNNLKIKSKEKKIFNKMQDMTTDKILKNNLLENNEISKSIDNLNNFYNYTPTFKSKYLQNKLGIKNSFVNKYFKSRAINYSKEDINPDVVDIQIRQEEETSTERNKNLTKVLRTGLHLLRKAIRSFQKRKKKGNPKEILKIYFCKWRIILEKMPKINYPKIEVFNIENKDSKKKPLKAKMDNNNINNTKKSYNNLNLIKKRNNCNDLNIIKNYSISTDSNNKNKTIKNLKEKDNVINDNKIIDKKIDLSITKKIKVNKIAKNKLKKSKSNSNFLLSNPYVKITKEKNNISKYQKIKTEQKNEIYKLINKLNKRKEKNLIYKYFHNWNNLIFDSFDYIPYHNKYKNTHKKINKDFNEEKGKNIITEEKLISSIKEIEITGFNSNDKNNNKKNDKKNLKYSYEDIKIEKHIKEMFKLKEEIKKSFSMNNNFLKFMNEGGNMPFINEFLKIFESQNKLISAYQIYYLYYKNNDNYYFKLKKYYFYKWLKNNEIFKYSINKECHIKSKDKHCFNCNCDRYNIKCIDCNCYKIKNILKEILIRHIFMKKINSRKYYLYLWYKKVFKKAKKIY